MQPDLRPPSSLAEASVRLEIMQRQFQLAEERNREQTEIMTDLLLLIGTRETCSQCGRAGVWVRVRGTGGAVLYNLDGTQHWPRCPQTARPAAVNE